MSRFQDFVQSAGPVANDIAFQCRVMKRIEQRRFRRALAEKFLIALAALLTLFGAAPMLGALWQDSLAPLIDDWVVLGLLVSIAYAAQQATRLRQV